MRDRDNVFCGLKLRPMCMIIGYLHLLSSIADITCHVLTVAIVTNGFQCDVSGDRLRTVTNLPFLELILLILNIGTHGFYPFPRVIKNQYNTFTEYMTISTEPKCYPGMIHVYLVDVLNLAINLLWLKIVIAYVGALHKNNPEPMRMFFSLSIVKLLMQVMYLGAQPQFYNFVDFELYWFLKVCDILIAIVLLIIVKKYTNFLKADKDQLPTVEKPPSYVECLVAQMEAMKYNNSTLKRDETTNEDEKINKEQYKICI